MTKKQRMKTAKALGMLRGVRIKGQMDNTQKETIRKVIRILKGLLDEIEEEDLKNAYVSLIRKRQREKAELLETIRKGGKVSLGGGSWLRMPKDCNVDPYKRFSAVIGQINW